MLVTVTISKVYFDKLYNDSPVSSKIDNFLYREYCSVSSEKCICIAICLDLTPDLFPYLPMYIYTRCFPYNIQVTYLTVLLSTAPVSKTSRYAIGSNVVSVVQTGVLIYTIARAGFLAVADLEVIMHNVLCLQKEDL